MAHAKIVLKYNSIKRVSKRRSVIWITTFPDSCFYRTKLICITKFCADLFCVYAFWHMLLRFFKKQRETFFKEMNDVVSHLIKTLDLLLKSTRLRKREMKKETFSTQMLFLFSNKYKSSQVRFIICLRDSTKNSQSTHWASNRSQRVT